MQAIEPLNIPAKILIFHHINPAVSIDLDFLPNTS